MAAVPQQQPPRAVRMVLAVVARLVRQAVVETKPSEAR